ncbi:MAG: hypothetical protein IKY26_09395 [Erysipelotrichaceae bacterium]|nr:hypothetical protein [Erysipelotrichaceae bacterium]
MKKYGLPLLIIIVGSFLVQLISNFLNFTGANEICTVLRVMVVFSFGLSLCQKKRRNQNNWVKKLVIAFFVFFLMCWEMGYFVFPGIKSILNFLNLTSFGYNLLYVYCGWAFFD